MNCKRQSSNIYTNKLTLKQQNAKKKLFLLQLERANFLHLKIGTNHLKLFETNQAFETNYSNFNRESSTLIHLIICIGCSKKYIGQTGGQLEERLSIYRKPEYEKIKVKRHLGTCAKRNI